MPQVAAKLNFEPYHEPFLIGINAGHFNEHANDHAGLSRLHKLSAIMEILRANEAEPQPLARNMSLRIPLDNAVGFKPPATLAEESND
ncbi:hypothetical protein BST29_16155 [Mycobacterium malmoense]|uniref:Uncharacterized protein n=2 Tax=Mycobacterium malmoense TaxID=1780 RepID=A0ABX3SQM5_MYCMA|nr:hypothetical protein BST29_16155 [Mycobacterium malmoense]